MWQRYANDLAQNLDKGVVLPEAEYYRAEEVHRALQGNKELVGWAFRARSVSNSITTDIRWIASRLGSNCGKDFDRNVYLVPDFGSYASLDPAMLPRLDNDIVLENWDTQQSFFSYRDHRYNTSFGIQGYAADQRQPNCTTTS